MPAAASSGRKTHRPLTVLALMLTAAMAAMEMTIVSTAMPTIVGELGGLSLYAWVAAVYLLTSTVTVPIYGKLADLYGRKPVVMFGTTTFLVGSVACAMSSTMPMLIAARALQGLGAGAMQPITMTIIGDLFDIRERARMQPWFGAVWGVAGLAGPMLGGFLVKSLSWHYVFWINLPFGVAAMAVLAFAFVEDVEKRPVKIDVAGTVLLTACVVALLVGIEGVAPVALLTISALSLVGFVLVERRAPEPVVPLDLFTSRVIGLGNLLTALLGGIMIGVATYVPLFVQAVAGGSPTAAGAAITPMVVGWPVAAFVAGRLLPRLGYRPLIVFGLVVAGASAIALPFVARADVSPWALRALSTALGVGLGSANTALIIVVQSTVPWERRGIATASNMFSRTIGATIAVGAMGALLSNVVHTEANVSPEAMQALLAHARPAGELLAEGGALTAALTHALALVFWANAALGAFGALASLFFPPVAAETREVSVAEPG